MWSDEAVVRFIGGVPETRNQTWQRLLRFSGLWSMLGYGYWAIEDRARSAFVGHVGFADFKRDTDPALPALAEMGWAIAPGYAGRGMASEAVALALAWWDRAHDRAQTFCLIDPPNAPSIRVAEKSGYRQTGDVTLNGAVTGLYLREVR